MKLSSVCQLAPFTSFLPSPSSSRSSLEMMLTSAHSGVRASCLRSTGVPNRAMASRNGTGASFWLADAEHEVVVQDVEQRRLRRRIGQAVEIDPADRGRHVRAEFLGLKIHGVTPGKRDNVRVDPSNHKREPPMKIAYSAASPYVRKVMACAIARGLNDKIERMKIGTTDPALLAYNPLSKVPTLITDDGMSLYDSPVICEYLDSLGTAPKLLSAPARRAGRRSRRRRWATASSMPPSRAAARSRCRRTRVARATSSCSRARSRARSTSWRRTPTRSAC